MVDVAAPENTIYPLQTLVDHCWGMLKGTARVTFPTTTPAHPSRYVVMQPQYVWYLRDFWEAVMVPTIANLLDHPPTCVNGWWNPMMRTTVEAYLRQTLTANPSWLTWVDLSR